MLLSTVVQLVTGHETAKICLNKSFTLSVQVRDVNFSHLCYFSMGLHRGRKMDDIMKSVTNAIYPIGMMILIIGGGGTFKQVLIDGGVGDTIAKLFEGSTMSPILLAWIVARITYCTRFNSRAISTTGIVLPLLQHSDANVALVVLAIGAGSVILSHVNDAILDV